MTKLVPLHWAIDVANSLLVGIRRGRLGKDRVSGFFEELRALPIRADFETTSKAFGGIFALAEQHRLTMYDAAYLELAIREGVSLATLDNDLRKAASVAGVSLA